MKNILAAAAAAGLAFAPIAAQAGTRAADSAVSLSALSIDRSSAAIGASEGLDDDDDDVTLLLLLGFAAVAAGIVIVVEGSENDTSPGTGG